MQCCAVLCSAVQHEARLKAKEKKQKTYAESLCATNQMNDNECHDQATRTDDVVNSSEDLASEDLGG